MVTHLSIDTLCSTAMFIKAIALPLSKTAVQVLILFLFDIGVFFCRHRQHVAGVKTRAETIERRVVETSSFAMNLFRGQIRPEEVFPFRDGINCI